MQNPGCREFHCGSSKQRGATPIIKALKHYKAIFEGVESALLRVGSRRLPLDKIRSYLETFKHLEGKPFTDGEYYQVLVRVIFYSGFRAATVTAKLPVIQAHFRSYESVAQYGSDEIHAVLKDPQMIKNRRKINACVENARTFKNIVREHGSFQEYIESFAPAKSDDNLIRLRRELQQRFHGLGGITTYHFLTDIGLPVLKPDRVVSRIFTRLGLVQSGAKPEAVVEEGSKFTQVTGHPIRYIDIVFASYGQLRSEGVGLERGICLEQNPSCPLCGVTKFCDYHAQRKGKAMQ